MALVSEQVKILLERMDMYPEEFVRPYEARRLVAKWQEVIMDGVFNKVERFLIMRKFNKLQRKATQEMIMQTIMDDSSPQDFSFDTVSRAAKTLMNTPRMRMKQP